MKIWWVFAYDQYYPRGGMSDFKGSFTTKEEAEEFGKTLRGYDYVDIVDIQSKLS